MPSLGMILATRVLTPQGAVPNEVKGLEHPIGLLDDGRLVTKEINPADGKYIRAKVWRKSQPSILVDKSGAFLVQGEKLYFIADDAPGVIQCVEIP